MKFIKELVEGDRVNGQFLVLNVTRGTSASGLQYYNVDLKDCSGTIQAKKWEINPDDDKVFAIGNVVELLIEVIKYKDALQAKILHASKVDDKDIDVLRFIQQPPVPTEELKKAFYQFKDSVKDSDCVKLLDYFVNQYQDKLFVYPAASSVHHEYYSGLLMHIVSMCKLGEFVASNYPNINRDLLISGIILHDIGKIKELEGLFVYHYSLEGKLLGHISIMSAEIKEASNKLGLTSETPLLLQHMILSHHGQLEYGSPVLPLTSEALALHLIDNMDSKLTIANKALLEVEPGESTARVFTLDGRCLYRHK